MENSYYQIADLFSKNSRSKHYDLFLNDPAEAQTLHNCEKFRKIESVLKEKFQVIHQLLGENNFRHISFEYFKYNPVQSAKFDSYGKSFSDFLGSYSLLVDYPYLKWLAKLDWFWFNRVENGESIQLPKGTLSSWACIYKNQNDIEIEINESIIERLQIQKIGKEIQIVSI